MHKTAEALPARTKFLRKYLGNEHPYDDTLPEREKDDERKDAESREKSEIEDEGALEWTVRVSTNRAGKLTYIVSGAYENGYTDESKSVTVNVFIRNPSSGGNNNGSDSEIDYDDPAYDSARRLMIEIIYKLVELFEKIFAMFGVQI